MTSRQVEMLHVVYADAVGYSHLSFAEKERFDEVLAEAVRSFASIGEAVAKVDNGDGFALAFRDDPGVAMNAAVSIRQFLSLRVPTQVRFGVHCGPALVRSDLSGAPSLSGHAIEHAQRVMSQCRPGEILVSATLLSILAAFPEWNSRLSIGRLGRGKDRAAIVVHALRNSTQARVALLGQPDGQSPDDWSRFLHKLEEHVEVLQIHPDLPFASLGEWEKQAATIDLVVVAGSLGQGEAAILSWLQHHEVPVVSHEPLSHIERASIFQNAQEDLLSGIARLVEELVGPSRFEPSSDGPVPADSPFYIRRSCDSELEQAIERHESVVLLRAPRRSGKSSLILRGVQFAKEKGAKTLLIDLEGADRAALATAESFYRWIISQMASEGALESNAPPWDSEIGPNSNLEIAIRQLLEKDSWLLVFDRIDRLWDFAHRDDFFGLLRSWHNRRAVSGDARWARLSVLLSYAGEAEALVSDVNQSPFNVGRRIEIAPLGRGDVGKLCQLAGHLHPERVFELTSGQPALVQALIARGLGPESAPEIVEALAQMSLFSSLRLKLESDDKLAKICAEILSDGRTTHARIAARLMSLGVFVPQSTGSLIPSSPLMASFLRSVLGGFTGRLR